MVAGGRKDVSSSVYPDPLLALQAAVEAADPADRIVVFGSFYTVGGVVVNGIPRLNAKHLGASGPHESVPSMAFFKFRWPGQGASAENRAKRPRSPQAESIEVMRRRARHRLMGAAVLVLLGVVGFPMLFDTQPRPIPVDVPIEIPDRNKAAPLVVPANAGDADATKSVVASSDRSGSRAAPVLSV